MPRIERNIELLQQTMDFVESLPDLNHSKYTAMHYREYPKHDFWWNQWEYHRIYECGTCMCYAGCSLHLSRCEMDRSRIPAKAMELLGISQGEAESLFYVKNSMKDLKNIVKGLIALELKERKEA